MTIIPTPWVMALVLVIFLILIYLLNQILYKPLIGFMDARDASIKRDSEGIEGNTNEIKMLKMEAEEVLVKAKQEAADIKSKAQEVAKEKAEIKISQKKSELQQKYLEFTRELEDEKERLQETLLGQVPQFQTALQSKLKNI
ncbi:F0F1 ATP synthase subunit B' [Helicobacter valdiviensis]|uniref:ATP synthase subunit b n=1 Tax=Helicobacter valdiviensis TaxID=1458358 RepID=A0A2W6MT86_9HELI|nr:F0F1 ATP synthase subunit B' [Helicobacter valdiviensis]PZT47687.1 F0F1 ATP synthase subunit B' [Helicobacter valdiviensis]